MANALDISGTEMKKMEEGEASGIKLMIKRKSETGESINKQEVAKQMEFIFGNMANKITNKKIVTKLSWKQEAIIIFMIIQIIPRNQLFIEIRLSFVKIVHGRS